MRDLQMPGRSVVHGARGAAATSHPYATFVALDVLRRGGNAADAAVAACATQCVVEPMSTGIGGDCFVLYWSAREGRLIGINGSGRAPAGLTVDHLLGQGHKAIGLESVHAITVPGAVDAWHLLLGDHGKLGLAAALAPAIEVAQAGFAVTPRIAVDWSRQAARIARDPDAVRLYLPNGAAPKAGERHVSPELARTLQAIAAHGRDGFYRGDVADKMVRTLTAKGGTHTLADFDGQRAFYVTPISTSYRGLDIHQIPPNGQGITMLMMLNILSGYDLAALDPLGVERFHLEAEASRLAYQARDTYVADPAFAEVPVERLLSAEFAGEMRARISRDRAMDPPGPVGGPVYRDTVYLTTADAEGNVCSFINSIYFAFGSTIADAETGVIFQNRGAGFVVNPDHPNCVAPGKRPMHTIIPAFATREGRPHLSFGVMGGAYQPVGQVHVLTNIVDFGMDVQEALDAPRGFHVSGVYDLERGVRPDVVAGLQALGHRTQTPDMPWGGGQAIKIDHVNRTLAAGSDPRKDGCALAY